MRRLMMLVFLLLGAAILPPPVPSHADEIYACVNKRTGTMRIVADTAFCRRFEQSLSLNSGAGAPGPQGPQGPPGSVKVYDSNSQFLGYLVSYPTQPFPTTPVTVFIPSINKIINLIPDPYSGITDLYIDHGQILDWQLQSGMQSDILFLDYGCTGIQLIGTDDNWIIKAFNGKYYTSESTIYSAPSSENPFHYKSYYGNNNTCIDCIDENGTLSDCTNSNGLWLYQAKEILITEIPFSLPVASPLRLRTE